MHPQTSIVRVSSPRRWLAATLVAALLFGVHPVRADGPTPAVCYYHSSPPSLASGTPDACEMDSGGDLKVQVAQNGAGAQVFSITGPGVVPFTGLMTDSATLLWNGSGWDTSFNNVNGTVIGSGSYTTTQISGDQTNFNGRGVQCVLDDTVPGTGSVTMEIDGKDPTSGKYYALLTGAAVTTQSTNAYTVYPGAAVTPNISASTVVPRTWRVKATANNANAATYSVGCSTAL